MLSADAIAGAAPVADADVKAYYEQNKGRYGVEEQRRASHILITPDGGDKAAARKKADGILAALKAAPNDFAKLAREQSKDPGSAAQGGDLGFFGKGMMVKPFEDAAFTLKVGETSEIIESDFGFHIIRVTEIKPAQAKPLDEVRRRNREGIAHAAGAEAIRGGGRAVHQPGLRTGRFAAARGRQARPEDRDAGQPDARRDAGRKGPAAGVHAARDRGTVLGRLTEEPAQHAGHRDRPEHAGGRTGGRPPAGRGTPARRSQGSHPPAAGAGGRGRARTQGRRRTHRRTHQAADRRRLLAGA